MTLSFSLLALAALLPSAVVPWRRHDDRDGLFYAMVALGVLGPRGPFCMPLSTSSKPIAVSSHS